MHDPTVRFTNGTHPWYVRAVLHTHRALVQKYRNPVLLSRTISFCMASLRLIGGSAAIKNATLTILRPVVLRGRPVTTRPISNNSQHQPIRFVPLESTRILPQNQHVSNASSSSDRWLIYKVFLAALIGSGLGALLIVDAKSINFSELDRLTKVLHAIDFDKLNETLRLSANLHVLIANPEIGPRVKYDSDWDAHWHALCNAAAVETSDHQRTWFTGTAGLKDASTSTIKSIKIDLLDVRLLEQPDAFIGLMVVLDPELSAPSETALIE